MHNIKILLFCWNLPSIPHPPPPGADHVIRGFSLSFWKMADLIEVEVLSFLKQEITC